MKFKNLIFMLVAIVVFSCNEERTSIYVDTVPTTFKVDIPSSLSNAGDALKTGIDPSLIVPGEELYDNLRTFIFVGEQSAQLIEDILQSIANYELSQPITMDYKSSDDDATKNINVVESVTLDSEKFSYKCTITDKSSDSIAMQIFWKFDPVVGVAILCPYYIDKTTDISYRNTMYRVDYSEMDDGTYIQQMTVSISGHPLKDEIFGIDKLKMFVGKKSNDIIDIYGNSNHPDAYFTNIDTIGISWAFVAKTDNGQNIATAQVGISPVTYAEIEGIFSKYDMQTALFNRYYRYFYSLDEAGFDADTIAVATMENSLWGILQNAEAPGYFNQNGYTNFGNNIPPTADYSKTLDLTDISPFVPATVNSMTITFDE